MEQKEIKDSCENEPVLALEADELTEEEELELGSDFKESDMTSANELQEVDYLSAYKFEDFAATFFQQNETHTYIKRPIELSLLPLKSKSDCVAALAVWTTILKIMGDLPEPNVCSGVQKAMDTTHVTTKPYINFERKTDLSMDNESGNELNSFIRNIGKRSIVDRLFSLTLKKNSHSTRQFLDRKNIDDTASQEKNNILEEKLTTHLDKLHFIIDNGICRPELRDEIYCQIAKQLTQNPSRSSRARGWILLALCVGCFVPSDKFIKYLMSFISKGPPGYALYCEERLRRTFANGTRNYPPSWFELQATKSKRPLMLLITLMDGNTKTLLADSATTAREVCDQLSEKIGLKDQCGFSLYIGLFDKVSSLGSGGDHVMDAISQCEQYAKEQGYQEGNTPWRLFFRKEIFTPWHDISEDSTATNLVYQQVVRGIKFGEYRCDKDDDLAMIAAQQYYIDYGSSLSNERLQSLLPSYIPDSLLAKPNALNYWMNQVNAKIRSPYFAIPRFVRRLKVKEDIVSYAKCKWPLLFLTCYEAYTFSGQGLSKNDVIIIVHCTGVYVVDDQENVLLDLSFPEIRAVSNSRTVKMHDQRLTLVTVKGDEYTFTSSNAEDIHDLVVTFLEGLKKRSKYVIALQEYNSQGDTFLNCKKGDLIVLLQQNGETVMNSGWCVGECVRTSRKGDFPTECVYVLPTITKPPPEILQLFVQTSEPAILVHTNGEVAMEPGENLYTLKDYAMDHFRPPPKRTLAETLSHAIRRGPGQVWRYSKEPLKQPLLKKLKGRKNVSQEACMCFLDILFTFILEYDEN